jgi:hypothetical protein
MQILFFTVLGEVREQFFNLLGNFVSNAILQETSHSIDWDVMAIGDGF